MWFHLGVVITIASWLNIHPSFSRISAQAIAGLWLALEHSWILTRQVWHSSVRGFLPVKPESVRLGRGLTTCCVMPMYFQPKGTRSAAALWTSDYSTAIVRSWHLETIISFLKYRSAIMGSLRFEMRNIFKWKEWSIGQCWADHWVAVVCPHIIWNEMHCSLLYHGFFISRQEKNPSHPIILFTIASQFMLQMCVLVPSILPFALPWFL